MKGRYLVGEDPPPRISYGSVSVLPIGTRRPRDPSWCSGTWDLAGTCSNVFFLLVHGLVAWGLGLVLLSWVLLGVVLVPLCGLGLLVLDLLFTSGMVAFAAQCDVAMTNYVASEREKIRLSDYSDCEELLRDLEQPPERLLSGLSRVSVESTMVLAYLVTIKLILAAVGVAVVGVVLVLPMVLLQSMLWTPSFLLEPSPASGWESFCAFAAVVLVLVVALLSVDFVVGMCSATTRFFCCERVYRLPLPRPGGRAQPRIVVLRLPSSSHSAAFVATTSSDSSTSATSL